MTCRSKLVGIVLLLSVVCAPGRAVLNSIRAARLRLAGHEPPSPTPGDAVDAPQRELVAPARPGSAEALRRQAWARLIRKVFEVDPLLCPPCQVEMVVVAWITEPVVIDRIQIKP